MVPIGLSHCKSTAKPPKNLEKSITKALKPNFGGNRFF